MQMKCLLLVFVITATTVGQEQSKNTESPFAWKDNGSELDIVFQGKRCATYVYRHDEILRPFFAHITSPSGVQVTRNFPPQQGDRDDHADMHPGVWFAFGDINGHDFWRNEGTVRHERFTHGPTLGSDAFTFTERKIYQAKDGTKICEEVFQCTIRKISDGILFVFDSKWTPLDVSEVFFGDQEEMGLGMRVASPITEILGGSITDARRRKGAKSIWGQSADWCDYNGTIAGKQVGLSIFCHPSNIRPSWMHARNYGLVAANLFGRRAMKQGEVSRIEVTRENPLRLRYGVFAHDKTEDLQGVFEQYCQIAATNLAK